MEALAFKLVPGSGREGLVLEGRLPLEEQLEAYAPRREACREAREEAAMPWKDGAETGLYCGLCPLWCAEVAGHYRSP